MTIFMGIMMFPRLVFAFFEKKRCPKRATAGALIMPPSTDRERLDESVRQLMAALSPD